MAIRLLQAPIMVSFEGMIKAIERFNGAGLNPFGPNVPVRTHSPLLFLMEFGQDIVVEVPFYSVDRDASAAAFLAEHPGFHTRHSVLYPMTRALIRRQWHRVYAYDVQRGDVTEVRLLVGRTQDAELFMKHPKASAWPWKLAVKEEKEPVSLD
jgi:hypothetical protein